MCKFMTGQNGCKYSRAKRKKKLGKNKLVYSIDSVNNNKQSYKYKI